MAKKRSTARARKQTTTSRKRAGTWLPSIGRKRLGIPLDPILSRLDVSIKRLQGQLRAFAGDERKTSALQKSIATLKSVRQQTNAICPSEILWYGVPVKEGKRSRR